LIKHQPAHTETRSLYPLACAIHLALFDLEQRAAQATQSRLSQIPRMAVTRKLPKSGE
jgi:hypothetical protein